MLSGMKIAKREQRRQTKHQVKLALGRIAQTKNVDEAFARTLDDVLKRGHPVKTYAHDRPDSARASSEILAFQIQIDNPRDRILLNPTRRFNIVEAVARLIWNIAASNRVEDIGFYQPKVRSFSDNGISVPGSNYWMRLLEPRPGVNQIDGVIHTLRDEVGSRRAASTIWCPEDAVRLSRDIPCAFGTFYHLRDNCLIATTCMRSNNAFLLLPYNTFEFSLLGEMIATTVGVELGPYLHFAASMHIYDDQRNAAETAVQAYNISVRQQQRQPMPPMPHNPAPFDQANHLAQLEAQLRHEYATCSPGELIARGECLHPYWRAFYHVLLAYALLRAGHRDDAEGVTRLLPSYLQQ